MKKNQFIITLLFLALFGIQAAQAQEVFRTVDIMPQFPGGQEALMEWMRNTMRYPSYAQDNNIQGTVLVGFVIDKDGSAIEPTIIQSVDPSLDQEALRMISVMPKWTPGYDKGKPVRVRFQIPIRFRLDSTMEVLLLAARAEGATWTIEQWKDAYRTVAFNIKPMMDEMQVIFKVAETDPNRAQILAQQYESKYGALGEQLEEFNAIANNTLNGSIVLNDKDFENQIKEEFNIPDF